MSRILSLSTLPAAALALALLAACDQPTGPRSAVRAASAQTQRELQAGDPRQEAQPGDDRGGRGNDDLGNDPRRQRLDDGANHRSGHDDVTPDVRREPQPGDDRNAPGNDDAANDARRQRRDDGANHR